MTEVPLSPEEQHEVLKAARAAGADLSGAAETSGPEVTVPLFLARKWLGDSERFHAAAEHEAQHDQQYMLGKSYALRDCAEELRAALAIVAAFAPRPAFHGYERIAEAIDAACEVADLEIAVWRSSRRIGPGAEEMLALARVLDKAGLVDWAGFDAPASAAPSDVDPLRQPCPGCGNDGPHLYPGPMPGPHVIECSCGDSWTHPDADPAMVAALEYWHRRFRDEHLAKIAMGAELDRGRVMRDRARALIDGLPPVHAQRLARILGEG